MPLPSERVLYSSHGEGTKVSFWYIRDIVLCRSEFRFRQKTLKTGFDPNRS